MKLDPFTGKPTQFSKFGRITTAVDPFHPTKQGTGLNEQGAMQDLRNKEKVDADRVNRNKKVDVDRVNRNKKVDADRVNRNKR
jgi:hypothetical protein